MKQYDLVLINEKQKAYRRISILLLVINFISIVFVTWLKDFTKWGPLIIALIAASAIFISFYFKNKNEIITFGAAFFLFSLAWQTAGYWAPAILDALLMILSGFASQKPIVSINENQITYPAFPKKQFHWQALNNVIIKDGLLSIDLKNNKLIQQLIDDTQTRVDEKEFNEFCRQQLDK